MKYKVDGWNNFCRIFRMPNEYPEGFCFSGGKPTTFIMVDWFNPVADIPQPGVSKETWIKELGDYVVKELDIDELADSLVPFVKSKGYIAPDANYIIICDFGASIIIEKENESYP